MLQRTNCKHFSTPLPKSKPVLTDLANNVMNGIYLITGGNLGDRLKNLKATQELLNRHEICVLRSSTIYESEAWGLKGSPNYLNQVHEVACALTPLNLLEVCLQIEQHLGRIRDGRWSPRTVDIDILLFGSQTISEQNLKIPHPRMAQRRFVLTPLAELCPDFIHPLHQCTIKNLLFNCPDPLQVWKFPDHQKNP